MQEHIELEVSLEKIMADIAQTIFKLNKYTEKKENLNLKLKKLLEVEEKAYKGNREAILLILNKEIKYE